MAIDLFSDNAGGLHLVDRARGIGWHGFERGPPPSSPPRLRPRGLWRQRSTTTMTTTLRTAFATKHTPDILDAARANFGADVAIGGTPNADPASPLATWPYPAGIFEVVGLACAHRSGPTFTVVRRKVDGASDRRPVLVDGLADLRTWITLLATRYRHEQQA